MSWVWVADLIKLLDQTWTHKLEQYPAAAERLGVLTIQYKERVTASLSTI